MNFKDLMRVAHVKRWHTVETTRPQTLAEHHWLVMLIALDLYKRLNPFAVDDWEYNLLSLLGTAMFHDVDEVHTGDIPAPVKGAFRAHGNLFIFRDLRDQFMPEPLYGISEPLHAHLGHVVKMADLIESAWFIDQHGVGIHAEVFTQRAWGEVHKAVAEFSGQEPRVTWAPSVASVIAELKSTPQVPA